MSTVPERIGIPIRPGTDAEEGREAAMRLVIKHGQQERTEQLGIYRKGPFIEFQLSLQLVATTAEREKLAKYDLLSQPILERGDGSFYVLSDFFEPVELTHWRYPPLQKSEEMTIERFQKVKSALMTAEDYDGETSLDL